MDVDNFAEYNVFEIYTANRDWPARNRRYWRPRTPNGRWRWLLYDLDVALKVRDHNTIAWATDPASSHPANAPWSTFVLRKLLENEGFEQSFINRYADRMNTIFLPGPMNEIVDQTQQHLEAEMPRHLARWGRTVEDWHEDISYLRRFINDRPAYARSHLMEYFNLTDTYELTLSASPAEGGDLALTGITIDSTFTGTYYIGVPVPLTAIPAPGYGFAGWSDLNLPQIPAVVLDPLLDYSVIAYFAPGGLGMVINEINYHSAATFDPEDWVEFHNASPYAVDMTGWEFKDEEEEHVFTFPVGTVVPAQDYLVLCRSLTQFLIYFPNVTSVIGVMDFGLSGGGEVVRLYDAGGALVDSVRYDDVPPWPPEPDGGGPTLELRHPELDNALAASWAASLAEHGTPAAQNSVYSGTGVTPQSPPGPELRLRLDAVYPNPFNPRANLRFAIPRRSHARLAVYAVGGRLVRTLENAVLPAGEYERVWWGRDDVGRPVTSGVYFVRLVVGEDRLQRKLLLLK